MNNSWRKHNRNHNRGRACISDARCLDLHIL